MWTRTSKDEILAEYLPQFHEPKRCQEAFASYVSTAKVLDEQRCRNWIDKALVHDEELAAIDLDPENLAIGPSHFELNGCYHCHGRGAVRKDVDRFQSEFGKAFKCPACYGADGDRSSHCPKCAAYSAEVAPECEWGQQEQPARTITRDYVAELTQQLTHQAPPPEPQPEQVALPDDEPLPW